MRLRRGLELALLVGLLGAGCGRVLGVKDISIDPTLPGSDGGTVSVPACALDVDCPMPAAIPTGCAVATCTAGSCVYHTRDGDQDGHPSAHCEAAGVNVSLGDDCDDDAPQLYPGHPMDCAEPDDGGAPIAFPSGQPVGACKFGQKSCNADGTVTRCLGAVGPVPVTTCTPTIDEGCTGNPLEGCSCTPGETTSCGTSSAGRCQKGVASCRPDNTFGPCVGAVEPGPRDCGAAVDNDCNGAIDDAEAACQCPGSAAPGATSACNAHPQDGTGACKAGSHTCTASGASSAWSPCTGDVGPTTEGCDAVDHDCNGVAGINEPAPPAPQPPLSASPTMNCAKIYRCAAPDRGALYYRNGTGFTNYAGSNTVWTAYAPRGDFSSGTYPPGTYRISRDSSATKMGPVSVSSACCGASGCPTVNVFSDGQGQFYTPP